MQKGPLCESPKVSMTTKFNKGKMKFTSEMVQDDEPEVINTAVAGTGGNDIDIGSE